MFGAGMIGMFFCVGCGSRPVETIGHLETIAVSEGDAAQRYAAFSAKAAEEGFRNIANLFQALACSEGVHLARNAKLLKKYADTTIVGVDSAVEAGRTLDNLAWTVRVKDSAAKEVFPIFVDCAHLEGAKEAERLLRWMGEVAERHVIYCQRALVKLGRDGSDINVINSWSVCPECGNLYYTTSLGEHCVLCSTPASLFHLFQ